MALHIFTMCEFYTTIKKNPQKEKYFFLDKDSTNSV